LAWHEGFLRGQAANGRPYRATINQMVTYAKAQAPPMTRHGERGSQHPYVAGGGAGWTLWAPPVA
jgi:hypothetical protein